MKTKYGKTARECEELAGGYLADGNEAKERGQRAKAEKLYRKSELWLMRANELREAKPC